MTKDELKDLVKDGSVWAAVENYIVQQTEAAKSDLADAQKALAAKTAQVVAGIATIQSIIADPETDTEKGITAFLHEETKDERAKQREAKLAQITALQAEVDSLK